MDSLAENGGNSFRIWLHPSTDTTDANIPVFDSNGFVTAMDSGGTLIAELEEFLDYAFAKNILVTIALWSGATNPGEK